MKAKCTWVHAFNIIMDFAIIISISNTKLFCACLTKYKYNNYIYTYYIYYI